MNGAEYVFENKPGEGFYKHIEIPLAMLLHGRIEAGPTIPDPSMPLVNILNAHFTNLDHQQLRVSTKVRSLPGEPRSKWYLVIETGEVPREQMP